MFTFHFHSLFLLHFSNLHFTALNKIEQQFYT